MPSVFGVPCSIFEISHHAMKAQQMPWLALIVNTQKECIALIRKENFNRVVGVTAIRKHLKLGQARLLKQFELGCSFWQRHIGVALFCQELLQHIISKTQTRTRECRAIFPAIASSPQVIAAGFGELLPHRHVGRRRKILLRNGSRAFNFPFFYKTKFIVLQQTESKFGRKYGNF